MGSIGTLRPGGGDGYSNAEDGQALLGSDSFTDAEGSREESLTTPYRSHRPSLSRQRQLNRRTIYGVYALVLLGWLALLVSLSLYFTGQYAPGCAILLVAALALTPGCYYSVYIHYGLKAAPGYNLATVPTWQS